ncbi:hypothetical protein [Flavobacterium sp. PL002]|uniref:hypothetical protein n=1 Tax=Flavobacterium sp. PL002 TaxID=1897058 RepID=UPI001787E2F8|nr:hypothetical protein [Flavobacterium sp. PL002]MBE0391552.1 hypothetical protein [Flavobacterium sp. PL002]
MKKNYILFFLLSWMNFFGQTYNFKITNGLLCNTCREEGVPTGPTYNEYDATAVSWSVRNNTITIASENKSGYIPHDKITTGYTKTFQAGSTFSIATNYTGIWQSENGFRYTINTNAILSQSIENLIVVVQFGYNDSNCDINAFSTNDIGTFPSVAYHWHYSLDNNIWTNFPVAIANNTHAPIFSIQQLLGALREYYFNKLIYFRIGYVQNRPFSSPFAITYLECAPVEQYINYETPKCNGDNIEKIEVFFKEKLKNGEDLSIIYVVNTDPAKTTPRFQNTALVTSFTLDPATNLYKYSFPNLKGKLENGNFYTVKYQSRLNGQPMGSLQISQQPFEYIDPPKMQFKITGQTQPTCFSGEVEILSGASPYNFYVDNVLTAASKMDNLHYKITSLKVNALRYKIKVTDTNGCV